MGPETPDPLKSKKVSRITENPSDGNRRQGGLAKSGNNRLRKLLVEAAWHYSSAARGEKKAVKGQVVAMEEEKSMELLQATC